MIIDLELVLPDYDMKQVHAIHLYGSGELVTSIFTHITC